MGLQKCWTFRTETERYWGCAMNCCEKIKQKKGVKFLVHRFLRHSWMHTNVSRELCGSVWKACGLGISRRKQIFLTIFCLHSKPLLELARMESSVLGPLFSHPHFTLWVHIHCPSPPEFIPHCFLLLPSPFLLSFFCNVFYTAFHTFPPSLSPHHNLYYFLHFFSFLGIRKVTSNSVIVRNFW